MILRKYRVNTMDTIFATTDPATGEPIKPLVLEMLPFLDQPPVASVMMQILFPSGGIALSLMAKKMGEYYQLLRQERFVEKLLALTTLLEGIFTFKNIIDHRQLCLFLAMTFPIVQI